MKYYFIQEKIVTSSLGLYWHTSSISSLTGRKILPQTGLPGIKNAGILARLPTVQRCAPGEMTTG